MRGRGGVGAVCELVTFRLGVNVHVLHPPLCPSRCVRGKGHTSRLLTYVCTHSECFKFHKLKTPGPECSKELMHSGVEIARQECVPRAGRSSSSSV